MIGSSKTVKENYQRKCFWTQEKETRVKFNPGLSANRPPNNWAQNFFINKFKKPSTFAKNLGQLYTERFELEVNLQFSILMGCWCLIYIIFFFAISLRFWISVVHPNVKAVFLKLREEICNLEFLQILTHFSGLFAAPRADFLLALVYNKATVACYSLCFFCL